MNLRIDRVTANNNGQKKERRGFTLLELLLVIAIIASLASIIFGRVSGMLEKATQARAQAELGQVSKATMQYVLDAAGEWPPDVNRGVPPGIEEYLGPGNWPLAPWQGSEYDWDNFIGSDGKPVYQISIRFCPLGQPTLCKFPNEPWAMNFDYYSSYYYCMQGKCKAHPGRPDNHPGFCTNCK